MNKAQRALVGLSSGHFVIDLYAAILIPLYPFIAQRLNIDLATISLVIALGHGVSSILQPVFGYLSDKMTKRFFMFFGIIFSSVFIPLGFNAPNAFVLTLCLFLGIVGNAFYHPQVTKIIKDFYKENIKLSGAIGVFLGLGTIGYAFGPYFSSYFLEKFGENNYAFIGIFGILTAFFVLFFVPRVQNAVQISEGGFLSALKDITKNKTCLFLVTVTIVKALMIMSFGTFIPFLLKKRGFLLTDVGLIMTLFYVAGGLAMIFAAKTEKFIKLKGMILISYLPLLFVTFLAVYFLKANPSVSVGLFLLDGFLVLFAAGSVLARAQSLVPNNAGMIGGIIQGFTLSMGSLLLIPAGNLAQKFGEAPVLVVITFVAFIIALVSLKKDL